MQHSENNFKKDTRIIIKWLAHHNPNRNDFDNHVFYIFNRAVCIGCFSFALGAVVALIICNVFYLYIKNYIRLPIVIVIFFFCWLPSILQYSIQIMRSHSLKNRKIKFFCRFLYPVGSIIFIFKSPIWGFSISILAGYLIIIIRKIFYKNTKLKNKKIE